MCPRVALFLIQLSVVSHPRIEVRAMSEFTRRDFMQAAGVAAVAATLVGSAGAEGESGVAKVALVPGAVDEKGEYALPKLPYAYDALEAAIDAKTMEIHHTKHHAGYVTGLKGALDELAKARAAGDFALVEHWSKKASFHAGGHFLHCIFWDCMGPAGGGEAAGALADRIKADFGSHEAMWKQFAAAAKAVEGSGWARLTLDVPSRRLMILQGQNQNLLSTFAEIPLLVLDVWEHAYYLRYQNKRADYVDAFAKVIDWQRIGARYDAAAKALSAS